MKVLRILLLLFMGFVVLLMAGCPGLFDSKRSFHAHRQYISAQRQHEPAASAETEREIGVAKQEVEQAKRLDRRDIMVFEVFILGIFCLSLYAFIRVGKSVQKISAAYSTHR